MNDGLDGNLIDDLILLKIFSHLPYKTLMQCLSVSKKWNYLTTHCLLTRKGRVQTLLYDYQIDKKEIDGSYSMDSNDLDRKIQTQLSCLHTKPDVAIYFLTKTTFGLLVYVNRKQTDQEKERQDLVTPFGRLQKLFPIKDNYYIYANSITGTNVNGDRSFELDSNFYKTQEDFDFNDNNGINIGLSGLLFPKSDSYSIQRYICTNENATDLDGLNEKSDIYRLLNISESDTFLGCQKLKLIVLFIQNNNQYIRKLLKYLNKFYLDEIAICGATIENVQVNNEIELLNKNVNFICLAYFGTKQFHVKQIKTKIIENFDAVHQNEYETKIKKDYNEKLEKLKNYFLRARVNTSSLFALNLKCYKTNLNLNGVNMEESDRLRSILGKSVPICGLSYYSVIANTHLSQVKNTEELSFLDWSSVLTVISIN